MNVSLKKNDAVSAILKIEIVTDDYAEQWNKTLRKLRQEAKMPGFRKGMVPFGMIKKLYGKHALVEEVNKLVSNQIYSYLDENNIRILGEPLPNQTEQKEIDFDTDESFEFCFDLALSPDLDIQLTKEDSLTSYRVIIDDEAIDKQIDSYRKSYGSLDDAEQVEENDLVKGVVAELEDGTPKADGIINEAATFMPKYIKEQASQKLFIGAKAGDKIVFNPYKAFEGSEAELASFLNIAKEAATAVKSDFSFEIKEIKRRKDAELNQELFDYIFGADAVKDEAEFRNKIKESLESQFAPEAAYKFRNDMRAMLIEKADHLTFADDILKRWLLATNEKMTEESVEADFPKVIRDLKYHLAKEKFVKELDIKVEQEDIEAMARQIAKLQFAQYGSFPGLEDMLDNYVQEMLKKQETVTNLADRVIEEKFAVCMKTLITVNEQEVTSEEFVKILQEQT